MVIQLYKWDVESHPQFPNIFKSNPTSGGLLTIGIHLYTFIYCRMGIEYGRIIQSKSHQTWLFKVFSSSFSYWAEEKKKQARKKQWNMQEYIYIYIWREKALFKKQMIRSGSIKPQKLNHPYIFFFGDAAIIYGFSDCPCLNWVISTEASSPGSGRSVLSPGQCLKNKQLEVRFLGAK